MTASGLLISGAIVPVPGLNVIPPAGAPGYGPSWVMLDPGDYRARRGRPFQVVLHSTKGAPRHYTKPGAGPSGAGRIVADFWHRDPTHSAAQLVIDRDGTVICLADLVAAEAYHATVSNAYSVGIELYQEGDGGIFEAVFDAAVKLVPAICAALSIPFQVVADPYKGHPLPRFLDGAPAFRGVLGHRNNTEARGWGDPGDEVFTRLIAAGAEPVLAGVGEDLARGRARQQWLNAESARRGLTWSPLVVDGLAGAASLAAAARILGPLARWRDVPVG